LALRAIELMEQIKVVEKEERLKMQSFEHWQQQILQARRLVSWFSSIMTSFTN
jgi:hypothetical protein